MLKVPLSVSFCVSLSLFVSSSKIGGILHKTFTMHIHYMLIHPPTHTTKETVGKLSLSESMNEAENKE